MRSIRTLGTLCAATTIALFSLGACGGGDTTAAPSCTDGELNGDETGVDCGGPGCGKCDVGAGCATPADCGTGVCEGGLCGCQAGFVPGPGGCVNADDCTPNPCNNGGTCSDGVDSFTCSCLAGFAGDLCEINADDCDPNPCENGGTCTDGVEDYTCQCAAGYWGSTCASTCEQGNCADGSVTCETGTCTPGGAGAPMGACLGG